MKFPLKNILRNFLNHVEDLEIRRSQNDDQYEEEFQRLKWLTEDLRNNPEYSCIYGLKDVNRPKNRYKDIVPYDFCRVVVPEYLGVPGSDYVNASHVRGASGAFAYIAAQGPLPNTVIDFWRMIWVCDVQVIVMACNERECGKTKCESYWPEPGEKKQYGTLSVGLVSQAQVCPDFLIRTLLVHQGEETREISQFHYTSWPDHGVPDRVHPILELVRLVRDCQASETAPILVHCSAGCGRTGTICAIDFVWACLRTGKLKEDFCLYDIVAEMRRQRIAMVQTKEQYMLVHRAVSTMFEQQLRLIDNHTYENLDRDGTPLSWTNKSKSTDEDLTVSSICESSEKDEAENHSPGISDTLLQTDEPKTVEGPCIANSCQEHVKSSCSEELKLYLKENSTSNLCLKETVNSTKTDVEPTVDDKPIHNSLGRLLLTSPGSAESIPFIDEDDTKSEIQVRARCGRAYLHIPSCDSISKIVDHFDPFADQVCSEIEVDSQEGRNSGDSFSVMTMDQVSTSEASNVTSCFGSQRTSRSSFQWIKGQIPEEPLVDGSDTESKSSSFIDKTVLAKIDNVAQEQNSKESSSKDHQTSPRESHSCGSSICPTDDYASNDKSCKESGRPFSRRPSIVKLKGLFDKSSRTRNNSKSSLFRHHSHHVSRAGSAPPSLNSMKRNSDNEKESVFAMVSRKFRSSSVKSEQELQKEFPSTSTSHLSTLKKSAANSLSTFRQNLSNFSWNIPFGKANKQAASAKQEGLKSPQPSSSKGHNKGTSKSDVWKKSTAPTSRVEVEPIGKLSPTSAYPDERDIIQQKFVVNVLTSSPAVRNKGLTLRSYSEKPNSPKGKSFLSDFECLKTNPVRLLGKSVSMRNNVDGPSALWYSNEECDEQENDEKKSLSPTSPLDSNSKTSKISNSSVTASHKEGAIDEGIFSKIKVKTPLPSSHSVFYTNVDGKQTVTNQSMSVGMEPDAEKTGNSKFFWPLSSLQESITQVQSGENFQKSVLKELTSASVHQEASRPEAESAIKTQYTEPQPNSDVAKVNDAKAFPVKPDSPLTKFSDITVDTKFKESMDQSNPFKSADELTLMTASKESKPTNNCENMPHVIALPEPNKEQELFSEPPALPRKTVVGKKHFHHFSLNTFVEPPKLPNNNLVKPEPCVAKPLENASLDKGNNLKILHDKLSENKQELYINVNDVAKKNIEQIESTLRNHPRGAIIDLTSRQSYSMEQELNDAIQKLPEPTKKKEPSATKIYPGYEVIWPEKTAGKSMRPAVHEQQSGKGRPHIAVHPSTGICYSPPLRRSVKASFPVLKSRSCASLDWLHSEQNDIGFQKKDKELKSDSTDTLVNEAVVELSTLLDELTTKTLSDDLSSLLDSPRSDKKDDIIKIPAEERVTQASSLHSPKLHSPNSSLAELKILSQNRSASPHKYETIYLPQKQALSIKHGNEEEIIFHFPPPPPIPPPPVDNIAETFDIICKDGIIQLPESNQNNVNASTTTMEGNSSNSCNDGSLNKSSMPTPTPRKSKHRLSGLRKSASYTTLMTQSTLSNEIAVNDHSQTLPRLQIASEVGPSLEPSSSLVLLVDKSTSSQTDFSRTNRKFSSDIDSKLVFKQHELNGNPRPGPSNKMGLIAMDIGDRSINYSNKSSKRDIPPHTNFVTAKQKFPDQIDPMRSDRSYIRSKPYTEGIKKSPSDIIHLPQFSRHFSMDQKCLYMTGTTTHRLNEPYTKHSPIYGKVVKYPSNNVGSNDAMLSGQGLDSVQVKKSLLPSRKDKPAPLPSSPKQVGDLVNLNEGKVVKKPASRKTERAPAPPVLQKSSSLRFNMSTSFDGSDTRASPTYAMIQKHKLPLVFENIPDSHSAAKPSSFRTMESIEGQAAGTKTAQQPHGCSLQHSHSDASVFLGLRQEKFLKKANGSAKPFGVNNTKTSSEGSSSSDSDTSYRNINFSNEQMFQKSFLKQRTALPVAPPRSKRRNTTEIRYMKDLKGAASQTAQSSLCDMLNECMPSVPVKTKEAFEIPDEFKGARSMNEKSESFRPHLTSDELKMAVQERMKRKIYRKQ